MLATTANQLLADALVVTRAMRASTIAEVFVEDEQVRVEIEFGSADLAAFANVLPDDLYAKFADDSRPFEQRLRAFLAEDWRIEADGQPLTGVVERITPAKRVIRDEVTGDPMAEQPVDAEVVIRLTLRFPLQGQPDSLTLNPPQRDGRATASIGFVCYHQGLPVNDFRYLSAEATVDLDWDDPWYSKFRHPNLRRQFDAPLSAFLYVEPYEVRKEIIVRPADLQQWVDLQLPANGVIPVSVQDTLKAACCRVSERQESRSRGRERGRGSSGPHPFHPPYASVDRHHRAARRIWR